MSVEGGMDHDEIYPGKGSYVLLIDLPEGQKIAVGSLKMIDFAAGCYAYVGSALGGMKSRLERHLKRDKKLHWHIDYLLQKARVDSMIICRSEDRMECAVARALSRRFGAVPGFGSSDCKCNSHLFYSPVGMEAEILEMLESLGMKPELVQNLSH